MTITEIGHAAEQYETCACGAHPGEPCRCEPGSIHWSRIYRAYRDGHIGRADWVESLSDGIVEGATACVVYRLGGAQ